MGAKECVLAASMAAAGKAAAAAAAGEIDARTQNADDAKIRAILQRTGVAITDRKRCTELALCRQLAASYLL